ncbi:MAG: 4Fe-4S binding protein [Dorea formicigenerans]|nr:4Fe-4S binding protein [Dorea formicigenerans]
MKACILIITLIGGLSVCRFFCKVMCPLGAIYGLLNKVSIYHMECNKKLASHVENVITYVRWM